MTAAAGARNLFKADAGVVHALLQARYYDGSKGEFLSEDPVFLGDPRSQVLTDPQSLNSYSYANDNPITKSDPNGRFALSLNYSANAEEGFGGFTSTYAGGGASFVLNPSTMQAWIVYTSSGANNVGYLKSYQSTPDNGQTPFVLGMYAGKGRSIGVSPNANSPADLVGVQNNINVNVGLLSFSVQGDDTNNPTYSFGAGTPGLGSVSKYAVSTVPVRSYSVNQAISNAGARVSNFYQTTIANIQMQVAAIQSKLNAISAQRSEKKP